MEAGLLIAALVALAVLTVLRFWPQKPVERCANCGHRRGAHTATNFAGAAGTSRQAETWTEYGYCLRTDCACTRYEP